MPSALVGQTMPTFKLPTLLDQNKEVTQDDLFSDKSKGDGSKSNSTQSNIVLLNVWATWCVYCKYEHPYLVDIMQSGRVSLYGLNYKDIRDDAKQWLVDYKNPYVFSIFDEHGKLGIELGVTAAPETFVIDPQGIIRMKHSGPIDANVWVEKFLPMIEAIELKTKAGRS